MKLSSVEQAIESFAAGNFVMVVDNEERENEGDLIVAAQMVTSEQLAFMVRHTSGLICLPMTRERLDELDIPMMVMDNTDAHRTAFTISIDYAPTTTTGISAADRARTIRATVDPEALPSDFSRPGHIFPLKARPGGVLRRVGQTEAAVDLANMADKQAARVTEIVDLHVGAEDKAAQNPDDASREGIFGQMELALDVIGRSLSEINRQMDRL